MSIDVVFVALAMLRVRTKGPRGLLRRFSRRVGCAPPRYRHRIVPRSPTRARDRIRPGHESSARMAHQCRSSRHRRSIGTGTWRFHSPVGLLNDQISNPTRGESSRRPDWWRSFAPLASGTRSSHRRYSRGPLVKTGSSIASLWHSGHRRCPVVGDPGRHSVPNISSILREGVSARNCHLTIAHSGGSYAGSRPRRL